MSKAASRLEAQFYHTLVAQLRSRRVAKGLTQLDVAVELGVSDQMVAKWENMLKVPTAFGLMCWCQVLGVGLTVADGQPVPPHIRIEPTRRAAAPTHQLTLFAA